MTFMDVSHGKAREESSPVLTGELNVTAIECSTETLSVSGVKYLITKIAT